MVSLGSVEEKIASILEIYEDLEFIVTAIEDEKKGEKIILLLSSCEVLDLHKIKHNLIEKFENKLMLPHGIYQVSQIPKIGSGKKDFKRAKSLAQELSD